MRQMEYPHKATVDANWSGFGSSIVVAQGAKND